MKKICFLFILFTLLSVNNSVAQYAMPQSSTNTFNIRAYQEKLKKFIDTLTPQEQLVFISSMTQSSSSNKCELDKRKGSVA